MRTDRQFSFGDLKISFLIPYNNPVKILLDTVDSSFICNLVKDKYPNEGPQGYVPSLRHSLLLNF